MGYTNWSNDAYNTISQSYVGKTQRQIFTQADAEEVANEMSPSGVTVRESRDSDIHPTSLAVAFFLDITGSMGQIPELIIRERLGGLMNTLIDNGILHPQIMFGAIGDQYSDKAKLQISQFESGTDELNKWLSKIWIEGNGGGQMRESYALAWYFAARHTSIDCFEKRGQKGFLFTVGDEANHPIIEASYLKSIFGINEASDISDKELIDEVTRKYHVYHIHVQEGSYANNPEIIGYWRGILGERLIILEDYRAIAETVASIVAVVNGIDIKKVTAAFDPKTALAVNNALVNVKTDVTTTDNNSGIAKP